LLFQFFSGVAGRLILAAMVLAVLIFGISQCRNVNNARQQSRVSDLQAEAAFNSATDAVGSVGGLHGRDTRTDDLTRENSNAIRSAPGAGAPVDPGLRSAGLDSLCRRPAYSGSEQCLQRSAAARMAEAGAARSAP
jgi:hypothetical protein